MRPSNETEVNGVMREAEKEGNNVGWYWSS